MMPAAKHFDPVIGVDIHIIQPPGPVPPLPVPHPFIGFLFDAFDYVPILGATIYVNGVPRAIAGTTGKTVPGVHFPIGGTFIKPPANECEMFMGSSTVNFDGDPASYMALPALSCQDIGMVAPFRINPKKKTKIKSLVLPTSAVLPIPLGLPVFIGGPPTISLMAIGMKLGMTALGKGLKRLAKTKLGRKIGAAWKKVSTKMHEAADKLMTKLGISKASRLRNAVHRGLCTVTGHPVDIATGKVYTESVDFELSGVVPIIWERVWYSTSTYSGPLGRGWHHTYDLGLIEDEDAVGLRLSDGRGVLFPKLDIGGSSTDEAEALTLRLDGQGYLLEDRDGRLLRLARCGRGDEYSLVSIEDKEGSRLVFSYNSQGLLARISDDSGVRLVAGWDHRGRITELRTFRPDSLDRSSTLVRYSYSDQDDLIAAYDSFDHPFLYEYSDHLLVRETDRGGYSFSFEYDARDEDARCLASRGQDGLYGVRLEYLPKHTVVTYGDQAHWTFRHNGQRVTEIVDPYGGAQQFRLDELGRLVEEVDPNGNSTRFEYDRKGAQIRRIRASGHSSAPEDDHELSSPDNYILPETPMEWDWGDLALHSSGGDPDIWILDQLPPAVQEALRRERVETAVGLPEEYVDNLGRVVERRYGDGTRESWAYDASSNVVAHRDRDGVTTRRGYGSWNLVANQIDALGNTTAFEYSDSAELTRVLDPGGTEYRFAYDHKDRNTEIRLNGRLLDGYVYDLADNLVERRDGQGNLLVKYEVGSGNVDTRRILSDGETHEFEYDAAGRTSLAKTALVSVEFEYDATGAVVRDIRNGGGVEHTVDEAFAVTRTTYFNRFEVNYARDPEDSDILTVTDPVGGSHQLLFGAEGEVLKQLSNQTNELSSYDSQGKCLSRHVWRDAGVEVSYQRYRYSPAGDLKEVRDSDGNATQYEYDGAHRLQREVRQSGGAFEYVFDSANNLIRQPGLERGMVWRANQLTSSAKEVFEYNDRGHMAARRGPSGETLYRYNALDLLTGVEINGQKWEAVYDPLGRRISKTWKGQLTQYWWDDSRIAAELRPDGTLRIYIYSDRKSLVPFLFIEYDRVDSPPQSGRPYFVFTNHIGVPIRVEDDRGRTVWRAEITPFGAALVTVNHGISMPIRFPGHYCDEETGLHYNRFRYYGPELGRYLQADPLGIEGDVNAYCYGTNPLTTVDIDGLAKCVGKPKAKSRKGKSRTGPKRKSKGLYERGGFRKSAVAKAKREAPLNKRGRMICPTCGKEIPSKISVKTKKGTIKRRGYDLDHYPDTWAERVEAMKKQPKPPTRSEVLDEYNRDLRAQCPPCNQSHAWEGVPGPFE